MFTPGVLRLINNFVDRAIGASDLSASVRDKLLGQQLASVSRMMPALLTASLIVSVIFVILTQDTSRFPLILSLLLSANLIFLYATYRALAPRKGHVLQNSRNATRTIVSALLAGGLWAVAISVLPVDQNSTLRGAALIGAGGLLCVSMMALIHYPQAMAAFTIPLIVGSISGLSGLNQSGDLWVQASLLMGFTSIMVTMTFTHASGFVAFRASEMLVQEKGEIIGLLLREFEQTTSDWIWGFQPDGSINRMTAGFSAATGLDEETLLGADFVGFLQGITASDDPLMAQIEWDVAARQTFQDVEMQIIAGDDERWWSLTGKPAFDESGNYLGYIGSGSDISERKIFERRITMLAHHDSMTGLLNRAKFTEQLTHCVARLERYGAAFAVMFLDLDQFKAVNDTRGHMTGDKLLVQVSQRIRAIVRDTDIAARFGGDEFAILLPHQCSVEHLETLAANLIEEIRKPFVIDGHMVSIGASIGIAIAPDHGDRPDQILSNADLALYRAKADGRSVFRFFEIKMDSEARERRRLEVELRDAIGRNELVLHYQPLVNASDGRPTGFEALIRWNHPERGLVPPTDFIPLAEQSDLIVDIGDWTIEQACIAAASWPDHLTVAVNLSAKHFRRSDIGAILRQALDLSGLAPHRLEIEITEGLLMEDVDEVMHKLTEIRSLGVTIAMDDFGTGYSSLSYLLKFPFDKIKIDRSFVEASTRDTVARDILRAIASLGKTLKLKITAEGVETAEQAAFLSEIACHQLQGFYFAHPLDSSELPQYLLSTVPTRDPAAITFASMAG